MTDYSAEGKTVLVTGGASGLGACYVEKFLELGAKRIAILDVQVEVGTAFAKRLNQAYPKKVLFIKCDVSKEDDIANAFDQVVAEFKQLDVLVNNAGVMVDAPKMWRIACDVNWQGLVSFTMKSIDHMSKAAGGAGGTIVNISSTAALTKFPFVPIYCGSKMAVLHFSHSIAMAPFFENTGVRILTLCPGPTDTPLLHDLEKRCYNPELGEFFCKFIAESNKEFQKVTSAVDAFFAMFSKGAPGSVWYTADDKPGRDITKEVDAAFASFEKDIMLQ